MILYINCCVRDESKTSRLVQAVLQKLGGEVAQIDLYEGNLHPFD